MTDDALGIRLRKILLVEDAPAVVMLVRSILLEQQGPITVGELLHGETLAEAIEIARSDQDKTIDVVLLDLTLPDSSGLKTLENFRALFPRLPIVVLTAIDDELVGLKALALGAQDYLIKDETYPRLLKRTVGHAVQRMRQELVLHEAKTKAEEATALKDKFVALVAHDLRGPLGAILSLIEISVNDRTVPLPEKHLDRLRYVLDGGNNLLNVVTQLLDISKLQTGKIVPHFSFCDGAYLVQSVLDRMMPLADVKQILFENNVTAHSRLYVDQVLFSQVLQNLISNAIKFSHSGQTIRIFTPPERPTTIAVQDEGVGIPEKNINMLFRLDEKVSTDGTMGEKGTGFGLSLCSNIVLAHGGTLSAVSKLGYGSTFYADLPTIRPRVLVVDDEPTIRGLMAIHLQGIDVDVIEATDGDEALSLLAHDPLPHLVISDVLMPRGDGFDLLRAMKAQERLRTVPVIIITGDSRMDTRYKALQMGADDFTVKPLIVHDFIPRVRRFVS